MAARKTGESRFGSVDVAVPQIRFAPSPAPEVDCDIWKRFEGDHAFRVSFSGAPNDESLSLSFEIRQKMIYFRSGLGRPSVAVNDENP
jgi:hypothetical protein